MKAHVRNGRLLLDEPTDLPEGAEVEVEIVDGEGWDMDPEELAELRKVLDESEADEKAGRTFSAEEVIAELRARSRK